jgi:hypothetical protein
MKPSHGVRDEAETAYGRWLGRGTQAGLGALAASFVVYVTGILAPLVPLEELPRLWQQPVSQFVAATGAPTGWGWVARLGTGDYLNLLGVALLASVTALAYARVLSVYLRRGDRWHAALAVAQIAVLLLAASGLLTGGH